VPQPRKTLAGRELLVSVDVSTVGAQTGMSLNLVKRGQWQFHTIMPLDVTPHR